jgi:tetratricopeptide (TPR) repeat protein
MATTKKKPSPKTPEVARPAERKRQAPPPQHSESFEAAVRDYEAALGLMRRGDYQTALEELRRIASQNGDEPELADRARVYASICERRLAPPAAAPQTNEERYHRAVVLANRGELDEALQFLNQAIRDEPTNVAALYARASVRALQSNAEAAVADLRQAILIDASVRHQAVNDPDFEKVRDDAAFIDLIEPSSTGA